MPYSQPCWFRLHRNCDQPTSTTTNAVDDIAFLSASAPSWTRTTVSTDGHKFSAPRRLSWRLLDRSKNVIFRSTPPSRPKKLVSSVHPYVRTSVRISVRPQKVSSISMKFGTWVDVDDLAWRYTVWPETRSRSRLRALDSRKFVHFQRQSPPPFIMGAGKWPRILK